MAKIASLLALVALTVSGQAATGKGASAPVRSGSVLATVGVSERRPPGLLSLDLRDGRYQLAPLPPAGGFREFTIVQVRQGRLAAAQLEDVRAAFAAAVSQGPVEPACASGGPPPRIVVSNAGVPTMELRSRNRKLTASKELGCWSEAALKLHGLLEKRFASEVYGNE